MADIEGFDLKHLTLCYNNVVISVSLFSHTELNCLVLFTLKKKKGKKKNMSWCAFILQTLFYVFAIFLGKLNIQEAT